jgi:hypothetical protein
LWLMFAAACGMAATYILKPYKETA